MYTHIYIYIHMFHVQDSFGVHSFKQKRQTETNKPLTPFSLIAHPFSLAGSGHHIHPTLDGHKTPPPPQNSCLTREEDAKTQTAGPTDVGVQSTKCRKYNAAV